MGISPGKAVLLPASVTPVSAEDMWVARGQIVSREILGSDTLFHIETEKGRVIVKTDTEVAGQIDSTVTVTVSWPHMHVFDQVSGKRVGRLNGREHVSTLAGGVS